jgi:hypothetical protein
MMQPHNDSVTQLTVNSKQAAKMLNCSVQNFYLMVKRGLFAPLKGYNRRNQQYAIAAIHKFVQNGGFNKDGK